MSEKTPVHPGMFIKEEIEARGWTKRDLAFILECPEKTLTQLMEGNIAVSTKMAKSLSMAFDMSPEFFLNLQKEEDNE